MIIRLYTSGRNNEKAVKGRRETVVIADMANLDLFTAVCTIRATCLLLLTIRGKNVFKNLNNCPHRV